MKEEKHTPAKRASTDSRLLLFAVLVLTGLIVYAIWQTGQSNDEKQYAFYRQIADSLFEHKAYEDAIKFYESALTYLPDDRYAIEQIKSARANIHITFINTFGGLDADEGTGLAMTPDGGYLLAGNTGNKGWLLKTDAHGQLERRETVGTAEINRINCLIPCHNGTFLAVGTIQNQGKNSIWLIQLTQEGRVDWQRTWETDSVSNSALAAIQTPDTSVWVAGYRQTADSTQTSALLVHFTQQGDVINYLNLGNDNANAATAIATMNDSLLVIAGYKQEPQLLTTNAWVALLDTTAKVIWQHVAGGNRNDVFTCMSLMPDNRITVAGHTQSYGNGSTDAWMVQYNPDGQEAWNKVIEGDGNDMVKAMVHLPDNSFALTGLTTSYGHGGKDAWLLKINRNGSMAWKKEIGEPEDDLANAIITTPDGGFALCGMITKAKNPDLCIVKTDVHGNISMK